MTIRTTIETISPEQAKDYLSGNTINRKLRSHHVSRLASDMASGRWQDNGASIVFNGDGTLLDGQHRLQAVVKANVPVTFVVARGISTAAMTTIDNNMTRSAGDVLSMTGIKNANETAAAVRVLLSLKLNISGGGKISTSEVVEFLDRHKDFAAHVNAVHNKYNGAVLALPIMTAWYYLALQSDRRRAIQAYDVILTGIPSYYGDPIHKARERLIQARAKGTHQGGSGRIRLFYTLAGAWNAFVADEQWDRCRMRNEFTKMTGVDYSLL